MLQFRGTGADWELAERNLMTFNEGKCQELQLGRNYPMHQHTLGSNPLESSSAEEDLIGLGGQQADNKPAMCPRGKGG